MNEPDEIRLKVAKTQGWKLFYLPPREFPRDYPYYDFTNDERRIRYQEGRAQEIDPVEHVREMAENDQEIFLHDLCRQLPDYPRDWNAAGKLLEEMQAAGLAWSIGYDSESKEYYAAWNAFGSDATNDWMMFNDPESVMVAICKAYLAWKEPKP